ncbi:sigma factor-like helix-turn-helix DNA-binding protein [Streptomyces sp. NPDC003327]
MKPATVKAAGHTAPPPLLPLDAQRQRLRAVAQRLLGSPVEADAAVEETLRWSEGDRPPAGERALTDLARVCLDLLRAREARRVDPWDPWAAPDAREERTAAGPGQRTLLLALDGLTPTERLAFVLHDMFAVPYEEVADVLDRTPAAARRLAARGRRRVRGTEEMPEPDLPRQREAVAAFLAAVRRGDTGVLRTLLDPDVLLRADAAAVRAGVRGAHGAGAVSLAFTGPAARVARPALVDGAAGLVVAPDGAPRLVLGFTVLDGRITAIDALAEEAHLDRIELRLPGEALLHP